MPTVIGSGEAKIEKYCLSFFVGTIAIADLHKLTLGPKGME